MKKRILISGIAMIALIGGCSDVGEEIDDASLPIGFEVVSEDKVRHGRIYKAKEVVTGCYYVMGSSAYSSSTTVSFEQMYIEKDGVSVPYCD